MAFRNMMAGKMVIETESGEPRCVRATSEGRAAVPLRTELEDGIGGLDAM